MKGMTPRAMAKACNGVFKGDEAVLDTEVKSITIDSRKISEGGLFIAIKGERSDGHDYINQCFEAGALCVVSEKELPDCAKPYIQVESTLQALKDLATFYRSMLDVKVVGITGSVGKTSTKETIYSVLSTKYKVLKTLGNFNNEIGLPLTVFRIEEDDEIAVLEMGISDFGEMSRLSAIAKPDVCVITNVGLCHLENLKSRDGILKAKTEIFNSMNPDGTVILNGDDDKLVSVNQVNGKRPMFFGISNKEGIYADNVKSLGLDGSSFTIHGVKTSDNYSTFDITVPVPGHHMVYNALAAATVGSIFGLSSLEIERGIKDLKTIAGRNNIIKDNGFTIIDDCYNANPVSMKASIDVLDIAIGRKVAILGDMFELGTNEKQMHYDVGMYFATKNIDILITVGSLSKNIALGAKAYYESNYNAFESKIYTFDTKQDLLKNIGQILLKNDNILVKASHGMEFPEIIEVIKQLD